MQVYTLEQGAKLVKNARYTIELLLTSPKFSTELIEKRLAEFDQRHGVFVTLYEYQTMSLRGCIGFTEGIEPLRKLLPQAAIAAATEDPRFEPVSREELQSIIIEVSILSEPKPIKGKPEELEKQIKIGQDGLIIQYGFYSGLLLPIVAVEEKWTPRQFLENVCIKAGLPAYTWRQQGVSLFKFSTQVFREKEPNGQIEEVKLDSI